MGFLVVVAGTGVALPGDVLAERTGLGSSFMGWSHEARASATRIGHSARWRRRLQYGDIDQRCHIVPSAEQERLNSTRPRAIAIPVIPAYAPVEVDSGAQLPLPSFDDSRAAALASLVNGATWRTTAHGVRSQLAQHSEPR